MTLVIVTDTEQRAALAAVRSLGRAGYRVACAEGPGPRLAGASRYATFRFPVPSPRVNPNGFVEALAAAIPRFHAEAVLPITEASCLAVLERPGALGGVQIPLPPVETFRRASNKYQTILAAEQEGIATPTLVVLAGPPKGPGALDGLSFPLVVKPARSIAETAGGDRRAGHPVMHAASQAELEVILEGLPVTAYPLLLQERIVGPGTGVFVLVREGQLVAAFMHQRLREKPPAGGVSVCSLSVPLDPALLDASRRLLHRLEWHSGVAMIEYKRRGTDGTPFLMEINPRFWGSLQLAVDCGVDFPRLLMDLALHRSGPIPRPLGEYMIGRRTRWWWGDLDRLLTLLRHSRSELHLPPDIPSNWRSIVAFLKPGDFGLRGNVFRWTDPVPWLHESAAWIRSTVGALMGHTSTATAPLSSAP